MRLWIYGTASLGAFTVKWAICENRCHGGTTYVKQSSKSAFSLCLFLWYVPLFLLFAMFSDILKGGTWRISIWAHAERWCVSLGEARSVHLCWSQAELLIFTWRRSTQNIQRHSSITISDANTLFYHYTTGAVGTNFGCRIQYELKQTNSLICKCWN